jgi:hypothetical protein
MVFSLNLLKFQPPPLIPPPSLGEGKPGKTGGNIKYLARVPLNNPHSLKGRKPNSVIQYLAILAIQNTSMNYKKGDY